MTLPSVYYKYLIFLPSFYYIYFNILQSFYDKLIIFVLNIKKMIQRFALQFLEQWKEKTDRKPLLLRGARQVGKSTLVEEFSKNYSVYLKLNLEKPGDKEVFERYTDMDSLLSAIYMQNRQTKSLEPTLLFIDKIQHSPKALAMLRYFYEEANYLHVIAAGSLLESTLHKEKASIPVGRVEYYPVRPCTFPEFLDGIGESFDKTQVPQIHAEAIHERIMRWFKAYTLVGGMPEAVATYAQRRDILSVNPVYDALLAAYIDDSEKYGHADSEIKALRHCLRVGWKSAAEAITFEGFGGSTFRSREMGNAMRALQKAFLIELVYPVGDTRLPILQNFRKKPKLLWLDTGLVNYASQIQEDVFSLSAIQDIWRGRIAEHVTGQELLCLNPGVNAERVYWRKDKEGSEAEVDFIFPFKGLAIPIEVKSGHIGKLRSLHLFMEDAPHALAVRVWSGPFSIDLVKTAHGKSFRLINLPFYYLCVLDKILDGLL
jgi:predicted AAA+ superfamily ATPase